MRSGLFQYDPQPGVVPPGSITNAELANMDPRTVKVNATNASASPQDLQGTTPLDVLRVNAAGTALEWGAPTNGLYVLKAGDTMTGPLEINYSGTGVTNTDAPLRVVSTNAGTDGPTGLFWHNSPSPAANDVIRIARAYFNNTLGSAVPSGGINITLNDPTSGAEATTLTLVTRQAGTTSTRVLVGNGLYMTGALGTDTGAGTINAVNYFDDGVNINTIYAALAGANVFTAAAGQTIQAASGSINLTLTTIDNGSTGPFLWFLHDSSSPAANDIVGIANFLGKDSAGNLQLYAGLRTVITDPTSGNESGFFNFNTTVAGTTAFRLSIGAGVYTATATGGDTGVGTFNATSYYANGNVVADTNGLLRARVLTVGTLPAAVQGAKAHVTDALAPAFGVAVAAGGAVSVPVYGDNTPAWIVG